MVELRLQHRPDAPEDGQRALRSREESRSEKERGQDSFPDSNAEHAITFAPGGDTILVTDNIFSGPIRDVPVPLGCANVSIQSSLGLQTQP